MVVGNVYGINNTYSSYPPPNIVGYISNQMCFYYHIFHVSYFTLGIARKKSLVNSQ